MDARRNVELKARDADPAATLAAALAAGARDEGELRQRDTYFLAREGRLKLREQSDGRAWLIPYRRVDEARARTSSYRLVEVPEPEALREALAASLGVSVTVEKTRRLLLRGATRIHLDAVAGLGDWVELEAVAPPGSDLTAEHADVAELRAALRLGEVVPQGYAALLLDGGAATERLVALARGAMERAYAPYSRFAVGAALRDEAGGLHAGANVENAAYPQSQCAEAAALGALVTAGGRALREVAVMADAELVTPCGGCRQRLVELGAPEVPVHLCGPEGIRRTVALGELLPRPFA